MTTSTYRGNVTVVPRRDHPEDDEIAVVVYQDPDTGVVAVHIEGKGVVKVYRDDTSKNIPGEVYTEVTT